jgi:hypothetical protein
MKQHWPDQVGEEVAKQAHFQPKFDRCEVELSGAIDLKGSTRSVS